MYGLHAISANNGWAITFVGISIVFTGLVFLALMISQIHKILNKSGIICALRAGAIRISVHLFNDESDIKRLIDVLYKCPK